MTNPNIEVKLKHYTGEETNLLIWDNEENDKVSIMDEKDSETGCRRRQAGKSCFWSPVAVPRGACAGEIGKNGDI